MSLLQVFGPQLPFLRRYARALTGSQKSGDAYIRTSLEALVEDPTLIEDSSNPRLALYRFFHAMWGGDGARIGNADHSTSKADERLQALAPLHRQAFLLTSLEGFTPSEAAKILNVAEAEFRTLERTAHDEIEAQMTTRALVIEDEPIIAADLQGLLEDLGHSVTGIASTHKEAIDLAKKNPPGIILCDIQLADGSSGIDAAMELLSMFDVPVIFITAFPERLLTGERPEPIFLIPKPFQESAVKAAIGQALFFHPATVPAAV